MLTQLDSNGILDPSSRMLAGAFILLAVVFAVQPDSISINFLGTKYDFDGTQIRYAVMAGIGMIIYPFSFAAVASILGHKRVSAIFALFGFTTMITSGIVVYVIILQEIAKIPLTLAALFAIPLMVSAAVGLIAYFRRV